MICTIRLLRLGIRITTRSNMSTSGETKVIDWKANINTKGEFVRSASAFRNHVTADGSSGFPAAAGRYHLYVSLACPWAHRTLIMRKLKGLEDVISYETVNWFMGETGWSFPGQKDTVNGCEYIYQIYRLANPDYNGRNTVPVLWDKQTKTIVSNESSEIIRMFNSEFNEFCQTDEQKKLNFYPEHLQQEIDELNSWIYTQINNGVYKAGFARSQEAYDAAVRPLFDGLDRVECILSKKRFLTGSEMTEADIRLFTTLIRFDPVYVGHFKCNKKRIVDYPNLWGYVRDMYQTAGISQTVDMEHICKHYMTSHVSINPYGIVSIGPELDYLAPHNRSELSG